MFVKEYGKRKCKKKTITDALVLSMVDIAKREGREDIEQILWNTWHCQRKLYTYEGKVYGKYCKNRHCTVCQSNRKAEMINRYYPVLKNWKEAQFLTLTIKSCPKKWLNGRLRKCLEGLNRITDKYDKRAKRGKGRKLIYVRSLGCNFNPYRREYNPHLHLIVPDKETAEILIKEWLALWTFKGCNKKPLATRAAQYYRPIQDMETDLVEVIKYGTKVFTDPEGKKKPKGIVKIYARAFYNIIVAMKGIRLFGSVGFKLPKNNKDERLPARVVTDHEEWVHTPELQNWVNTYEWETLFDQLPNPDIEELLEWCIDGEKE